MMLINNSSVQHPYTQSCNEIRFGDRSRHGILAKLRLTKILRLVTISQEFTVPKFNVFLYPKKMFLESKCVMHLWRAFVGHFTTFPSMSGLGIDRAIRESFLLMSMCICTRYLECLQIENKLIKVRIVIVLPFILSFLFPAINLAKRLSNFIVFTIILGFAV